MVTVMTMIQTAYPGAAEFNPATLCLKDSDDDGYGDMVTNPGVLAGTDCDDNDPATYIGSAELDSTSLCMTDVDGDGYGEQNPAVVIFPALTVMMAMPTWPPATLMEMDTQHVQEIVMTTLYTPSLVLPT